MNANERTNRARILIVGLALFSLATSVEHLGRATAAELDYSSLQSELGQLRTKVAKARGEMIERFNTYWKTAGEQQLPIDAEELIHGSGLYKV
jgi:hypothetical protein